MSSILLDYLVFIRNIRLFSLSASQAPSFVVDGSVIVRRPVIFFSELLSFLSRFPESLVKGARHQNRISKSIWKFYDGQFLSLAGLR
jgi:hypothetical protein